MKSGKSRKYNSFVNFHRKVAKLMYVEFSRSQRRKGERVNSFLFFYIVFFSYLLVHQLGLATIFFEHFHSILFDFVPASEAHYKFSSKLGEEAFFAYFLSLLFSPFVFYYFSFSCYSKSLSQSINSTYSVFKCYLTYLCLILLTFFFYDFFHASPGRYLNEDTIYIKNGPFVKLCYENEIAMSFWFPILISFVFPMLSGILVNQIIRNFYMSFLVIKKHCYGRDTRKGDSH